MIYWRKPIDEGIIGEGCKLLEEDIIGSHDPEGRPLLFVGPHFCLFCKYRGKECKRPIWFPELKREDTEDLKEYIFAKLRGDKK